MHILAIPGSIRKESFNRKLAHAFAALAPEGTTIEVADIGTLPLFNGDLEAAYPAEAQALKEKVEAADGILIITPEYNRSMPGVLKNAIDWASRPWGKNSFKGKPVITAGVSSGKIGTAVAQSHLKQVMVYLDARIVGQPELYLGPASDIFDAGGNLVHEETKELLTKALEALTERAGK